MKLKNLAALMFRFFGAFTLLLSLPDVLIAAFDRTDWEPLAIALFQAAIAWAMIYYSKELAQMFCKGLDDEVR